MIIVGGVTLDEDVNVDGFESSSSTSSSLQNTIGGEAYIVSSTRVSTPSIVFASDEDYGWQSLTTVQALKAVEQAGGVIDVNVHGETFTAVFENGLQAEKVSRSAPYGHAQDYYKVTFSLIKVS